MRPRRLVLAALTVVALAAGVAGGIDVAAAPGGSQAPVEPVEPPVAATALAPLEPAGGAYFGTYHSPRGGDSLAVKQAEMTALEAAVGRRFDIDRIFHRWGDDMPSAYTRWTAAQGRIPMISLNPRKRSGGAPTPWGTIAAGAEDAYLRRIAQQLRAWGQPAFFTFHHEPESEQCPNDSLAGCDLGTHYGTAAEYRAAWRHVHDVFLEAGNTQLAYTFVTTTYRFKTDPRTDPRYGGNFYPGDDVIDWIGADPYNFIGGGSRADFDKEWHTLGADVAKWYAWAEAKGKPLALAEYGAREDPADIWRKAAWFHQLRDEMPTRFPRIKAYVYFNSYPGESSGDGMNWRVDSSPISLAGFRNLGADPRFSPSSVAVPQPTTPPVVVPPRGGYWMLTGLGDVFAFGDAPGLARVPEEVASLAGGRGGYWVVARDGDVHARGVPHHGQPELARGDVAASIVATPRGDGYWVFTRSGRAHAYGAARFLGDMAGTPLNGGIVAAAATPSGQGYWLVGADGGIFTFGDARFSGSTGNLRLNEPVVGIAPDPDGTGYWLIAADGGIFAFEAGFRGSVPQALRPGQRLNRPVVGGIAYGNGYLMVGSDGGIFAFSDKPFLGSLGATPPPIPVVAVAATP